MREKALAKIADAKKGADKQLYQPIADYLKERIGEDEGLAEDVAKADKTWKEMERYIFLQAKKTAGSARSCAIRSDVVFEWAEDYFRKDDKALKKEQPKEKAVSTVPNNVKERHEKALAKGVEKAAAAKAERAERPEAAKEAAAAKVTKSEKKPKAKKVEYDGQMSLFDFLPEG